MAIIRVATCAVEQPDGTRCSSTDIIWVDVSYVDIVTLNDILFTVDIETVSAIFGGGLLLFITGIGAGWMVKMLNMIR